MRKRGKGDGPDLGMPPSERGASVVGAVIAGRYRIRRRIASGGIATVYEGLIAELGKRVAIKLIDERFADEGEVVERFRLEARAASAIESEHIVQVFDVGEDPQFGLFMVMELLQGEDLGKRLHREPERRVPLDVAATVGLQASWALAKAHELGIVHRDLKPENLFLVERSAPGTFVKLLDFGIAKLTRELGLGMAGLTARGATLGTPQYMSPEQIQAVPDIDPRTDIWSLGAVLFEALAGRPVFAEKATFAETLMQICRDRPPKLADVAPWVPEDFAAVVDAALEPDRDKRIPDARTFATRLLEVAHEPLAVAFAPTSLVMSARPSARARASAKLDVPAAYLADVTFREFGDGELDAPSSSPLVRLGPAGTTVPLELTPLPPLGSRETRETSPPPSGSASPPSSRARIASQAGIASVGPAPHEGFARSVPPSSVRPSSPGPLRPSYAPRRSFAPRKRGRKTSLAITAAGALIVLLSLGDLALRALAPPGSRAAATLDLRKAQGTPPRTREVHFAIGVKTREHLLTTPDDAGEANPPDATTTDDDGASDLGGPVARPGTRRRP